MRLAFRTDASLQIGTGHVIRCLTLARHLRDAGAECRFITRDLPGHLGDRIAAEGFALTLLPPPQRAPQETPPQGPPTHAVWAGVDWAQDARETHESLSEQPTDWVVMDHYAFDTRWQRAALPIETKLMVIDDLADRPHACDLLLDQNLGRNVSDYDGLVPAGARCLIGPAYALLRPEFAAMRPQALADRAARRLHVLLITMGGFDASDATSAVLNALREAALPPDMTITVVMGATAPALKKVQALAVTMPCPTQVVVDVPDMAYHMYVADLAISAGGGTTWERCCVGLPSIIVETAENQAGIARTMAAAGAAFDPGPLQAADFGRALETALCEARDPARLRAMSANAATICDGEGVVLVAMRLMATEKSNNSAVEVRV